MASRRPLTGRRFAGRWSARSTAGTAVLAALSVVATDAHADWIDDPEAPSTPAPPSGDPAPAPDDAADDGLILDPEAPPRVEPRPAATERIDDPEVNAIAPAAPSRAAAGWSPQASFRGNALSQSQLDLQRQGSDEDTFELLNEVTLGLRMRFSERWSAVVEGRLSWWVTSGYAGADSALVTAPEDWQGRVEPVLRDAYVSGRAGEWRFRLGQVPVRWGVSDFSRPADVVAPRDLRRAPFGSPEEARIPVPAIDATWIRDRIAWQFLVIPFFVSNQQAVIGSDQAAIRQGSPLQSALPLDLIQRAIDPSTEDRINPAISQTELPEELLRNLQFGTRLTSSYGGMDLSLSWLFGFDRTPFVRVAPSVQALGEVLSNRAPGAPLVEINGESIAAIGPVIDDINAGRTLVEATYRRYNVIALDGVRYVGPIGVRIESAFSPLRTVYQEGLRSTRRPQLASSVGLSYERDSVVVISAEAFYQHIFDRAEDSAWLFGQDRLWGTALAIQWDLASIAPQGSFFEDVSVQTASLFFPTGLDLMVIPAVKWAPEWGFSVEAGAAIYTSLDDERATLGDVLEWNDAAWLRLGQTF